MRSCSWPLALCAAAILLYTQQCSALRAPKQITLDANGCEGVQWNALGDKFGYSVNFDLHPLAPSCNAGHVRVSKLYVQDACVDRRDNNWEVKLEKEHILCSKAVYPDTKTCRQIMKYGPEDSRVLASSLKMKNADLTATIDKDNICYDTAHAFVFIENNCSEPVSATVTLETKTYAGETCVVVEGHALGVAGIIGIAIAVLVVLALLSGVLKCLCCCL